MFSALGKSRFADVLVQTHLCISLTYNITKPLARRGVLTKVQNLRLHLQSNKALLHDLFHFVDKQTLTHGISEIKELESIDCYKRLKYQQQ